MNRDKTVTANFVKLGEVDGITSGGRGGISANDAYLALKYAMDAETPGGELTADKILAAGVDRTDGVSPNDAYEILKYFMGASNTWPIDEE